MSNGEVVDEGCPKWLQNCLAASKSPNPAIEALKVNHPRPFLILLVCRCRGLSDHHHVSVSSLPTRVSQTQDNLRVRFNLWCQCTIDVPQF